ncbi:MAG: GTPase Era [Bacillota bacterium]
MEYLSGFAAIVGRPNVGKSTLLNALVGTKVAIVSDKPQTTRRRILGVVDEPGGQLVCIDTPGIHKPKHALGQTMVGQALGALAEVDLILHVVDASSRPAGGERYVAQRLAAVATPVVLVLNKLDLAPDVRAAALAYGALHQYTSVASVSALAGTGLTELKRLCFSFLSPGPRYFPEGTVTDQPEHLLVAELVRERILLHTREEVPHAVAVAVEEMTERASGLFYVSAAIYVEKESQKAIIIGQGGRLLRQVGQEARLEIEGMLGVRLYLDLWVKVRKDWRNDRRSLAGLGYEPGRR